MAGVERYDEVLPSELRAGDVVEHDGQWRTVERLHHYRACSVATWRDEPWDTGWSKLEPGHRLRRRVA